MSSDDNDKEIVVVRINKNDLDKKSIKIKLDKRNIIVYDKEKFRISK